MTEPTEVLLLRLDPDLPPPSYARPGDAGANLPTATDAGYAVFGHLRNGLAAGIKVILYNSDAREPVALRRGDRIAQLVVQRVEHAVFREVGALPASARGEGGHGSTGR